MSGILDKAQQEDAKRIKTILDSATEGLAPGSPEYKAAYLKALEDIAGSTLRVDVEPPVQKRKVWVFSAEKAQHVFTENKDVIIRPIQIDDADFYVSVKMQYAMEYRAVIQIEHADSRRLMMDDLLKPQSFYCIVESAAEHTPIGYLGIKSSLDEIWEIAVELDGQFTQKGYGPKSISLFLNELHKRTGKTEYKALVATDNIPSQKCFEKLGAELIGLCNGPYLKLEEEKERFEENNMNLIDDNMRQLAVRLGAEPRKLLSHVLEYRIICPILFNH